MRQLNCQNPAIKAFDNTLQLDLIAQLFKNKSFYSTAMDFTPSLPKALQTLRISYRNLLLSNVIFAIHMTLIKYHHLDIIYKS